MKIRRSLRCAAYATLACIALSACAPSNEGAESHAPSAPAADVPKGSGPATEVAKPPSPVGSWRSVDFVRQIDQFKPGAKFWREDLFLKEFQCFADGTTSLGGTCRDGWLTHPDGRTRAKYVIKTIDGSTYMFLPWLSGDVTIRGQKPSYYVLQRQPGTSQQSGRSPQAGTQRRSFQTVTPIDRVEPYADVRWRDMSALDFSPWPDLPATLTFNRDTVWPERSRMPRMCFPREIMDDAKNPGLGIRALHERGITGKGVNVAIIDQPLFQDHPEFTGKIAAYHDVGCGSQGSMHGPAVASLLVGATCGTAPDARVYYVAAPSWNKDAAPYAQALEWILSQNDTLAGTETIRVVSVSAAPSGPGSPFTRNHQAWDRACRRAEGQGVLVLDCTQHHGVIGPCYYDPSDPENVAKCRPGFPGRPSGFSDKLLVPSSPRTTAEEYTHGEHSYQYNGRGGLSWAIPYCAGVLALGWQARPDLTAEHMVHCLFQSAHVTGDGARIIQPVQFIRLVGGSASRLPDPGNSEGDSADTILNCRISGAVQRGGKRTLMWA